MSDSANVLNVSTQKHLKTPEFIGYLVAVFFYTNMTGMVGAFRDEYFVNVLHLDPNSNSLFRVLTMIIPFVFSFFVSMYVDGRSTGKKGKFRPLALMVAIPMAIVLVLTFTVPTQLKENVMMIYITTLAIVWSLCTQFGDSINKMAIVTSPNLKERDTVMSFRGISSAVGNSAPQLIILILGLIFAKNKALQYVIAASLCGVVGVLTMLFGLKLTRERVYTNATKSNPLLGFKEVVSNKYAWVIIISETLKSFRSIASYMGIYLAGALLGDTSKFLLFGLPTGIGTAVGMLVINFLLKKFNSKVLYIASGIYSLTINIIAFIVGYVYFQTENSILQGVFILALFLIGLQFGASNLLPTMFQADVLEDLELKSGKRLDASLPFVVGIGTMISGTIASYLAPQVLYGNTALNVIGYIQAAEGSTETPEQSLQTKIALLFFYTIVHGIMMFLAGVPYFFYKLTGKTKEDIHNAVIEKRMKLEAENKANS